PCPSGHRSEANSLSQEGVSAVSTPVSPDASRSNHPIKKVAILFAGGPAPAANAVISTAAVSFLRHGIQVIGILGGYSKIAALRPDTPWQEGRAYIVINHRTLRRTRSTRGILIGTARTNPGKSINCPADLDDPEKSAPLRTIHAALKSLGVDALVSIG